MVRAFILPVGFATDAFGDLADRAAAATLRARKGITHLANASAFRAQNFPALRARHKRGFIYTAGHELVDQHQPPLARLDSFL